MTSSQKESSLSGDKEKEYFLDTSKSNKNVLKREDKNTVTYIGTGASPVVS